jgi:N-methylhydantoinase A/oxoprolinase/acetone carboxylase beta subunit
MYRIGVDVGGTNTDAVVMTGATIVAAAKKATSADITTGLLGALQDVQRSAGISSADVGLVVIGTTHFTNAVVERRRLSPTAAIRLCLPAAQVLPPMVDWPADLRAVVSGPTYFAEGGVEFNGSPISSFDAASIERIGSDIRRRGITAIAITGVFSPVRSQFEEQAAAILAACCPDATITLSSQIGQLGFLERESATILNSSLQHLAHETVQALLQGVRDCHLQCPVYLSQNDGTLLDLGRAEAFPVLTCASGPTNSMRGAAFLSGHTDAIVVDVGGTTTDVGLLHQGFPRHSATTVDIGGVRTNFRMPDVSSVGLGGGSIVRSTDSGVRIGPESVGFRLVERARVFGGDTLTATDIAVAAGRANIGDPQLVHDITAAFQERCLLEMARILEAAVERCRTSPVPLPIIAVGGGSILVPPVVAGLTVTRPAHFSCANAVGAAIAQVSGEVDRVYSLESAPRNEALAAAEVEARQKAITAGARPESIVVMEREDVPLAYLQGSATRIRVKVVGEMQL